VEVHHERLEEYAEGEDKERGAEEESDGTHEDDQPSVEESRPLAGHGNSGRDMGVLDAAMLAAGDPLLGNGSGERL
jgi:hypothetical protein